MLFRNISSVIVMLYLLSAVFAMPRLLSSVLPKEKNDINSEVVANVEEQCLDGGLQKYAGVFGGGGLDYSQELSPVDLPLPEHIRVKRFTD